MNNTAILERPLQKFTTSKIAAQMPETLEGILSVIVNGNIGSLEDLFTIPEEGKRKIEAVLTAGYLTLADHDREKFLDNTEGLLSDRSRNEIWERNHECILGAINWITQNKYRFPTIKELCEETQLSRVTVTKHLKHYYNSDTYKEKENVLKFLREKLLAKVYGFAYEGNIRAAKVFLDATEPPQQRVKINKQQINNVQVNNNNAVIISKDQLEQLPTDKQEQLKEILSLVTPQTNDNV